MVEISNYAITPVCPVCDMVMRVMKRCEDKKRAIVACQTRGCDQSNVGYYINIPVMIAEKVDE